MVTDDPKQDREPFVGRIVNPDPRLGGCPNCADLRLQLAAAQRAVTSSGVAGAIREAVRLARAQAFRDVAARFFGKQKRHQEYWLNRARQAALGQEEK